MKYTNLSKRVNNYFENTEPYLPLEAWKLDKNGKFKFIEEIEDEKECESFTVSIKTYPQRSYYDEYIQELIYITHIECRIFCANANETRAYGNSANCESIAFVQAFNMMPALLKILFDKAENSPNVEQYAKPIENILLYKAPYVRNMLKELLPHLNDPDERALTMEELGHWLHESLGLTLKLVRKGKYTKTYKLTNNKMTRN